MVLRPLQHATIHTGLYLKIPTGYEGHIRPSMTVVKHQVSLLYSHATIDSEYSGELTVVLKNYGDYPYTIHNGDTIAQLILAPYARASVEMVTEMEGIRRLEGSSAPSASRYSDGNNMSMPRSSSGGAGGDSDLPAARPIYDDDESPPELPAAIGYDPKKEALAKEERQRKSRIKTLAYLGAGAVVVVIILVLAILLAKKDGGDTVIVLAPPNATESPTLAPTMAPTWQGEGDYVINLLPEQTVDAIVKGDTPQREALYWLLGDSTWRKYSDSRLLQRFALATFYYATGGKDWNKGWMFDSTQGWMDYNTHECDWAFTNDSNFHETENSTEFFLVKDKPCELMEVAESGVEELLYDRLWFRDAGMSGSLPPEVFLLLTNLKVITFRGNQLTGTISPLVGELSHLEAIDLSFNKLGGTIPEELAKCTNLQGLLIDGTESEPIENKLRGTIPTWLGELQELKFLELGEMAFTGTIPSEIGLLTNLVTFYAHKNLLTGSIPTEVGRLTELWEFMVEKNCIDCDTDPTGLTGTLPTELGLLTQLMKFSITANKLTGTLPTELGLVPMWKFYSGRNRLSGPMPTELGLWSDLSIFSLWSSQNITGTIPTEIGLLTNAIVFDLQNTQVSGTIPTEVGLMASMEELFWAEMKLTGTLPTELGLWTNMWIMNLYNNALTGTLPSEIGLLTGMEELYLYSNLLSGSISQEVADLPILLIFNAANNDLTGEIPAYDMVVSGNFTDPDVGAWMSVYSRAINLTGNALTGTIPSSMCVIDNEDYSLLHYDCSLLLCGCSCSCDTGMAIEASNMTDMDIDALEANMTETDIDIDALEANMTEADMTLTIFGEATANTTNATTRLRRH